LDVKTVEIPVKGRTTIDVNLEEDIASLDEVVIVGYGTQRKESVVAALVDGVKRSMNDIDMNDIENLSVLKDASATAVFGVEGANGVVLITTKRGQVGKAELSLTFNTTIKTVSQLPEKLDSYNSLLEANSAILRGVAQQPLTWNNYTPLDIVDRYRNPASLEESYIYPNVDWEDELLKDFAQDYRVNLSVRGGNKTAKYFGSLASF